MILKKPYAILIKNFKLLHIVLFFALAFLVYKSNKIYTFLNDYLLGNYYDFQENLALTYVNITMFFAVIIVIVFAVTLYLLMKYKSKNKKYYLFLTIYYLILFGLFIFFFVYITNMERSNFDKKVLKIVTDLAFMMTIPQYLFAAFALFRGLGFDLKKFNFAKDLADLDINVKDSEEFEIVFKNDGYKVKRSFRKTLKEIYYYIVENRQMLMLVLGLILVVFLVWGFINSKLNTNDYKQGKVYYANGFKHEVTDSYITALNHRGEVIDETKKYMVVKFNITNTMTSDSEIDLNTVKLMIQSKVMYPVMNKYDLFIDLGVGYKRGTELKYNEKNEYILVFEMDRELEVTNPRFRITDQSSLLEGQIGSKYSDALLEPEKSLKVVNEGDYSLGENIDFSKSSLKDSQFKLNNYNDEDQYEVDYKYCADKDCFTGVKILQGEELSTYPKCVLRLKYSFKKDKSASVFSTIQTSSDFLNAFGKIEYTVDNKKYFSDINDITPENLSKSYRYFEANERILEADKIKFVIAVRDKKYEVNVK